MESIIDTNKDILILIVALVLDLIFGDPPNRFHPVCLMGGVLLFCDHRAPGGGHNRQIIFGAILVIGGALLFAAPWYFLFTRVNMPVGIYIFLNAILLKSVISFRNLIRVGLKVGRELKKRDLGEARRLVAFHLVSRPAGDLDEDHVASATIESVAENLVDGFLSPLMAYVVGGIPLAWAYRFINTADAMIGYHDPDHEYTGKATARLDDAFNWIPARLGGVLISLVSGLTGGSIFQSLRVMMSQNSRTDSPNAGWPMSAAAGALNIRLEKTGQYVLGKPSAAFPKVEDIRRACLLISGAAAAGSILFALILWSFSNAG